MCFAREEGTAGVDNATAATQLWCIFGKALAKV
jgi:hypothetical protein